jgi:hypothetical protein
VDKDEALGYLKLRKVNDKLAEQIYGLAGGRMVLLKTIADVIEEGFELNGMCVVSL